MPNLSPELRKSKNIISRTTEAAEKPKKTKKPTKKRPAASQEPEDTEPPAKSSRAKKGK